MLESEHILHRIDFVNRQYNALLPNYQSGFEVEIVPIWGIDTESLEQFLVISFII